MPLWLQYVPQGYTGQPQQQQQQQQQQYPMKGQYPPTQQPLPSPTYGPQGGMRPNAPPHYANGQSSYMPNSNQYPQSRQMPPQGMPPHQGMPPSQGMSSQGQPPFNQYNNPSQPPPQGMQVSCILFNSFTSLLYSHVILSLCVIETLHLCKSCLNITLPVKHDFF